MVRVVPLRFLKCFLLLALLCAIFFVFSGAGLVRAQSAGQGGVDLALNGPDLLNASAGGVAWVQVDAANLGLERASAVRMTMNVPLGLLLSSPDLPMRCAVRTCHWSLRDLGGRRKSTLAVGVTLPADPGVEYYDLQFAISGAQAEGSLANNTKTIRLVVTGGQGEVPEPKVQQPQVLEPKVLEPTVPVVVVEPIFEPTPAQPKPALTERGRDLKFFPYIRKP